MTNKPEGQNNILRLKKFRGHRLQLSLCLLWVLLVQWRQRNLFLKHDLTR